ncbi:transketolase, partial [Listeria monocytogenes]|nr:transketolase [Listeria monocytogenes]
IGFGAPNAGTSKVHGAPLGDEGIFEAKKAYGWNYEEKFFVPEEVTARFKETIGERVEKAETALNELFASYKAEYPELSKQLEYSLTNK